MKKLLNVLQSRGIFIAFAVFLVVLVVWTAINLRKPPERVAAYDYRFCDSFRNGMPDYGIRNRRNILPST